MIAQFREKVIKLSTLPKPTQEAEPTIDQIIAQNIQTLLVNRTRPAPWSDEYKYPLCDDEGLYVNEVYPSELKFWIFKVKKRAEYEYKNITRDTRDDKFQFKFKVDGIASQMPSFKKDGQNKLAYSYNWPYDFFSLIELAKVDAEYTLMEDKIMEKVGKQT